MPKDTEDESDTRPKNYSSELSSRKAAPATSASSIRKRARSGSLSLQSSSLQRKRKVEQVALPTADLSGECANDRRVLAEYEAELTCPICCDIFAAAQLSNPCGHTLCGECGWKWYERNREEPTCAVCRVRLCVANPMIPSIAMDNTVEKHIVALAAYNDSEWAPGGQRYREWRSRKERWEAASIIRAARLPKMPSSAPAANTAHMDLPVFEIFDELDFEYFAALLELPDG
ncbi:hypothetical protein OBBRIDRAFT_883117 [Obba rivulosa]|uniref:RING-type domain-containing protein n=1 Tax=Obba rivulosa TaxID=1052685 RepID=A0A8E2J7B8_9APHY|nr:hypothetical protein OBBRIDRAFT_883117 [Obba rivulosa]